MTAPPSPARARAGFAWPMAIAAALLIGAAVVAYHNSFRAPFVFDDIPAIRDNATLRELWTAFSPPRDTGVGGRPLANVSFAFSHIVGGGAVWAHHALNLLLHVGSGLLLFGIVRRMMRSRGDDAARAAAEETAMGASRPQAMAAWLAAWIAALLWLVHPLTTGAVTYLSQRTELLMAFCFLFTLYAFLRGWLIGSALACAAGMLSKENMAATPLIVLLFDRTFVAGTFRAAWEQCRRYYVALGASWLVLGALLTTGLHQRSLGFGLGVSPLDYALTECRALLLYLQLAVWPAPLVFDYGRDYEATATATLVCVILVIALLAATAFGVRRRSGLGFAGAACFLLLAPSSSFVPVAETPIAENRAYLPLAVLIAAAALGGARAARRRNDSAPAILAPCLLASALVLLTVARNHVYQSELALWSDTVAKRPQNARAQFNRGVALLDLSRAAEAAAAFERAIGLNPREPKAHNSLGNALLELGRTADAVPHFAEAVAMNPSYARAWFNYGTALLRLHRAAEAISRFERALQLDPRMAEAENALGNAFFQMEQPARALPHYEAALRLDPALADAHYNCGSAALELGRIEDAVAHFAAAVKLKPADAEIRNNLGAALVRAGRLADAAAEFETAVRLKPDYTEARDNLALVRRELPRPK